ncbi:MAG: zf-HC2 domain-containing protein [Anaerolineaceae bacterium]|nr:zf-HC2 domain-containing protein [Anaerolineaceae bacterium]MCB9100527.1 zf-HC2 domain-containing protein [Anaerolineales bacterium]
MVDKNNPQIDNEYIRDLLSPYLDGEVDDAERALVEEAIADSDELQAELDSLRQTVVLLNNLPPVPAPRPFTLTQADVQPVAPAPQKRSWFGWWLGGFSAAAAAVLCVAVGWAMFNFNSQSTLQVAQAPAQERAAQSQAAATVEAPMTAMEAPAAEEAPAADMAQQEEAAEEAAAAQAEMADSLGDQNNSGGQQPAAADSEAAAKSQAEMPSMTATPTALPTPAQALALPPTLTLESAPVAPPPQPSEEGETLQALEAPEATDETLTIESVPSTANSPTVEPNGQGGSLPETAEAPAAAREADIGTEAPQDQTLMAEGEESMAAAEAAPVEESPASTETESMAASEAASDEGTIQAEAAETESMAAAEAAPAQESEAAQDAASNPEITLTEPEATPSEIVQPYEASSPTPTLAAVQPQAPAAAPELPGEARPAEESVGLTEQPAEEAGATGEADAITQSGPQVEGLPTATVSTQPAPTIVAAATATALPSAISPQAAPAARGTPVTDDGAAPSSVLPWLFSTVLILLAMLTIIVLLIILRISRRP